MTNKRVSIKDVAISAGVSVATVSYVLNGNAKSKRITEDTILKVQKVITEKGYKPNISAINLRSGYTNTIAVIIPDLSCYFFSLALRGIETFAAEQNYQLIIYQTFDSLEREKEIFEYLTYKTAEGVLFSASIGNKGENEHIKKLSEIIPVVGFDRVVEGVELSEIVADDFEAGYNAGKFLLSKGCKNIIFLGLDEIVSVFKLRYQGFRKAIEELAPYKVDLKVLMCDNNDSAYQSIVNEIKSENKYDGLFSCNESYTLQLLNAAMAESSDNVFKRMPIVSFYNYLDANLLSPKIYSIKQDPFEMGIAACTILLNNLNGIKKKVKTTVERIVIPCNYEFG